MADIMQFVRELLEGQAPNIGVRGTVVHAIKVPTDIIGSPTVYLYQVDVGGYVYQDIGCTRDPDLEDLLIGSEVLSHRPAPDTEGFPIFLLLTKAPAADDVSEVKEATEVGKSDAAAMEGTEVTAPFPLEERDAQRKSEAVTAAL